MMSFRDIEEKKFRETVRSRNLESERKLILISIILTNGGYKAYIQISSHTLDSFLIIFLDS